MVAPNIATDSLDPQRAAVYEAEEEAAQHFFDPETGDDLPPIAPEDLRAFAADAMTRAGWSGDAEPTFVLDVPDDSDLSAWHEGRSGHIHMHPLLLRPAHVLHELAHWLRPGDGHGPAFVGVYLGLVRATLGADMGQALRDEFDAHGVEVDESWM